ncbi:MAG: hypothetical protein K2N82_12755 [Lachnospiraceae bacterium]|nr:hypothetical protein [Lachnospiraceae bacterium]
METVRGYVDHVIFQNKDNGYAVISFDTEGEELVCVGTFRSVEAGEMLEVPVNELQKWLTDYIAAEIEKCSVK